METFIVDDLPAHVARTFQIRPGRAAIGGLSMGGYGAIRLGLRHPQKYGSIYAHSSRLPSAAELPMFAFERGIGEDAEDLDVDDLAARVDRASMPALAFDCGTEDFLLADSRRFRDRLVALGLPHEYREHPGAHDWDYWDRHVPAALAHPRRVLGF
jgi:S-formylglutathione hydrolase FrmB